MIFLRGLILLPFAGLFACGSGSDASTDTDAGSGSTSSTPSTSNAMTMGATTMSPSTTTDDSVSGTSSGDPSDPTTLDSSGGSSESTAEIPLEPFSFFVTSLAAMQELSGSDAGFGGDLRFGEDGPGAGLRGADAICAAIAEQSMPGSSAKQWRAFLSVEDDGTGASVNAIDRIGAGPWYDRIGRLVASAPADLQHERPQGGDAAIADDLPNEDGVPNHQPDPTQPEVDNHDTLTGSDELGMLAGGGATCSDWTSAVGEQDVQPRVGHSWPRDNNSGRQWISEHDAGGCAPGVNINGGGGPQPGDYTVGAGGGYGGIYCFALVP